MALSYNLGYQESISVHPTRRQNFAGKVDSSFPKIRHWVISKMANILKRWLSTWTKVTLCSSRGDISGLKSSYPTAQTSCKLIGKHPLAPRNDTGAAHLYWLFTLTWHMAPWVDGNRNFETVSREKCHFSTVYIFMPLLRFKLEEKVLENRTNSIPLFSHSVLHEVIVRYH